MKKNAYMDIARCFDEQIAVLEKEIENLKARKQQEFNRLHEQCLALYGSHEDDGGFMFGCCARCGAFLG